MLHSLHPRIFPKAVFSWFGLLAPAMGQQGESRKGGKKNQAKPRLIGISALQPDQAVILDSRDEKAEWLEIGNAGPGSSFIPDRSPGLMAFSLPMSGAFV
jgi:hypothetical protein